jgi:hypothetical protein
MGGSISSPEGGYARQDAQGRDDLTGHALRGEGLRSSVHHRQPGPGPGVADPARAGHRARARFEPTPARCPAAGARGHAGTGRYLKPGQLLRLACGRSAAQRARVSPPPELGRQVGAAGAGAGDSSGSARDAGGARCLPRSRMTEPPLAEVLASPDRVPVKRANIQVLPRDEDAVPGIRNYSGPINTAPSQYNRAEESGLTIDPDGLAAPWSAATST